VDTGSSSDPTVLANLDLSPDPIVLGANLTIAAKAYLSTFVPLTLITTQVTIVCIRRRGLERDLWPDREPRDLQEVLRCLDLHSLR
jgi:hypothetical protein